jgi:hypothetical protein
LSNLSCFSDPLGPLCVSGLGHSGNAWQSAKDADKFIWPFLAVGEIGIGGLGERFLAWVGSVGAFGDAG